MLLAVFDSLNIDLCLATASDAIKQVSLILVLLKGVSNFLDSRELLLIVGDIFWLLLFGEKQRGWVNFLGENLNELLGF
jgi:hypothetical protein